MISGLYREITGTKLLEDVSLSLKNTLAFRKEGLIVHVGLPSRMFLVNPISKRRTNLVLKGRIPALGMAEHRAMKAESTCVLTCRCLPQAFRESADRQS